MNEQLTVKTLYEYCEREIKKGNADKKIVISDDNEGNGFHGLYYAFTELTKTSQGTYSEEVQEYINNIYDSGDTNPDNLIILG